MTLVDENIAKLARLGLQLDSSFESNPDNFLVSNPSRGAITERVSYVDLELPGTRQIFSRETQFLRPRVYFSNIISPPDPCMGHEEHKDPDCHVNLLFQDLIECCYFKDNENVSGSGYGVLVLLGPISPLRLAALVKKEKPLLVCCIYQSEDEWLPWVCCQELDSLLVELRSLGVVFRARKSVRLRSDLEALLFDELLGFIGSALLVANVSDPRVSRLVEGLGSCVMSGLRAKTGGPCVDEFLMMKHSRINFRNKRISFYRQPDLLLERPVVLIGSGPSLDQSLSVRSLINN